MVVVVVPPLHQRLGRFQSELSQQGVMELQLLLLMVAYYSDKVSRMMNSVGRTTSGTDRSF